MALIKRIRPLLTPRNDKAVDFAIQELTFLSPTIQQSTENGLGVNSYEILYYHKVEGGRLCTCSQLSNAQIPSRLDPHGNASPTHIESLLSPNSPFSINEYTSGTEAAKPVKGVPNTGGKGEFTAPANTGANSANIDPFEPQPDFSDIADEPLAPFSSPAGTYCGICLGTNTIPGFSLYGGERVIFDSTNTDRVEGLLLNKESRPYSFKGDQGWVEFTLVIPKGVGEVQVVRVRNNAKAAEGRVVLRDTTTGVETNATPANILSAAGTVTGLRVYPTSGEFTHVEIIWLYRMAPIYVDYPNFEVINDLNVQFGEQNVELAVGPSIPKAEVYDLILDPTFQKAWRVTQVTTHFNREQLIYGWMVQGRILQDYEIYRTLYMPPAKQDTIPVGTLQRYTGG